MPRFLGQSFDYGTPAWEFELDDGSIYPTDDPDQALMLGATPEMLASAAPAPGTSPVPRPPPPGGPQPEPPPEPPPAPSPAPAPGTPVPPGRPPLSEAMPSVPDVPVMPDQRTALFDAKKDAERITGSGMMSMPDGSTTKGDTGEQSEQPEQAADAEPVIDTSPVTGDRQAPGPEQQQDPTWWSQGDRQITPEGPQLKIDPGRPGGWVDVKRKMKGPEGSDELRALADAQYVNRITTEQARQEAATSEYERRYRENALASLRIQEEESQARAELAEKEKYKREKMASLDREEPEIASRTVDPKRYFKDDPFGVFIAAISVGLGEMSSKARGGPNNALNIINSYIDRDIAEQQAEIDAAALKNEKARNALQRLLDDGEDPKFAREKLKALQTRAAAAYLGMEEAQSGLEALGVNTMDRVNEVMGQYIQLRANLEGMTEVEAEQKYQQARAPSISREGRDEYLMRITGTNNPIDAINKYEEFFGVRPPESWIDAMGKQTAKAQASGQTGEKTIRWRGEEIGQAATVEEGKKIRDQFAATEQMLTAINEIERLMDNWSSLSPDDRAAATARVRNLQLNAKGKALFEMGVLAGPDLDMLEDTISNPNDFFSLQSRARERYRVLRENLITKANTTARSQGINKPLR